MVFGRSANVWNSIPLFRTAQQSFPPWKFVHSPHKLDHKKQTQVGGQKLKINAGVA